MAKRKKSQIVRLLNDLIIPIGTTCTVEPPFKRQTMCDYVSVLIPHGNDRTSEWTMPLDDAVIYGLVSAPEDAPVAKPKARTT